MNSPSPADTRKTPRGSLLGGLLVLLACQSLGEAIKIVTGVPLPGAVIGMLILLAVLMVRGGVPAWLGEAGCRLIGALSLLFLPPAVGLFFLGPRFADQWPAVIGAVVLGTLITLAVTALVMQCLLARSDKRRQP